MERMKVYLLQVMLKSKKNIKHATFGTGANRGANTYL
jgi:hypothetical protein